jgi:putative peptide zinc metalloprotease protein
MLVLCLASFFFIKIFYVGTVLILTISLNSFLSLVPIEIRRDKKNYIVEDKSSGEFYEMPEVCIEAINMIDNRASLGQIEFYLKEKYPNEEIDVLDFAEQLLELQLISEIDGVKVDLNERKKDSSEFLWISPQVGKFFFNKLAFIVYIGLFFTSVFLFLSHPNLFPHYKDIFIFKIMALNIPSLMVLTLILVLIHEFGHVLAMRAKNLPTKMEVGHRLFLVVLETDMSAVWKLPSKTRNVLFMAGLCFDTTILVFALVSQLIFSSGSEIFLSIMHVIVLDTIIRMIYQCCIYMKTDLYYVFENISGCYNLMENAQRLLPFLRSVSNSEVVYEEEKRTVVIYSIFYIFGVLLSLFLFLCYYIPQLLFSFKRIIPGFSEDLTSLHFWDAAIFTLQLLIGVFLLLHSWRKKYFNRSEI